jgi:hypothetical protein
VGHVRIVRTSLLIGCATIVCACGALIGLDDVDRVECLGATCTGADAEPDRFAAGVEVDAADASTTGDGTTKTPKVWDDFERGDAVTLGTSPSGHGWAPLSGSWAIKDRQASKQNGPVMSIAVIDGQAADGIVSVTLKGVVATAGQECGLGVRWAASVGPAPVGTGYIFVNQTNYDRWVFIEVDGNRDGGPYSDPYDVINRTPKEGDRLSIEMRGDRMKLFVNNTLVLDKAGFLKNTTSTKHGLAISWNGESDKCRLDDYAFEP